MTIEQIEQFIADNEIQPGKVIRFEMKKRDPIKGIFVKGRDYNDLKVKNFWRIIPQSRVAAYEQTKDIGLARIFAGSEFQKLSFVTMKVE